MSVHLKFHFQNDDNNAARESRYRWRLLIFDAYTIDKRNACASIFEKARPSATPMSVECDMLMILSSYILR